MHDARKALLEWTSAGALPRERLRDALRAAGVTPTGEQWQAFLERLLTWLGATLIAAAAVHFIAANWPAMGRFAKFALVEAALVVVLGVVTWRGLDALAGRAALFAAALLMGVLLALVGQVYQTGADTFELFAAWAAVIVVWVCAGRQPALWLLWIALVDIAILLYFRTSVARGLDLPAVLFAPTVAWWVIFALDAVALAAWERAGAVRGGWIAARWVPRVLATVCGTLVMLLVCWDIAGLSARGFTWSWAPFTLWIAALYGAYRIRTVDLFMLAGMVLSVIGVVSFALGRPAIEQGGAGGFLVGALILVGCAATGSFWLRQVAAEHLQ